MRAIPAMDIIGGKCVRLTRGDYSTLKVYSGDPVETARRFEDAGLRYLHLVDLDGAREGKIVNHAVLEKIASSTSIKIDFGGGIRSEDDIAAAFECGAAQVNCGSIAAENRTLFMEWLSRFGAEKIILAADSRERMVSVKGWSAGITRDIADFIYDYSLLGVEYAVCTDISRDGMMEGPSTDLYREILSQCKINLIASGGISSLADLNELAQAGCDGAIVGKALYEGLIKPEELAEIC